MREWNEPTLDELNVSETAKKGDNNGNNDTHEHKGWCPMHKNSAAGICTCGASINNPS